MAEFTQPVKAMRAPLWTQPVARGLFWTAALCALASAGVALFAASEAGWHGFILLAGFAVAAFLLLYALAAGEAAGRALREKAERHALPGPSALALEALDLLADPVLVTNRKGAPRWGNAAYRDIAKTAGGLGQSLALAGPDRIWAGSDGAVYRLILAANSGATARERMPALDMGGETRRYDIEVRPSGDDHIVWRVMPSVDEATGEKDTRLRPDWADNAPAGLMAIDPKGTLLDGNATLREWLGLKRDDALPALRDMLTGDGARAVLKTCGQPDTVRLDARLKGREGVETPIAIAVRWEGGKQPVGRAIIYGLSTTGAPPGIAQAMPSGAKAGRTFDEMFFSAPFGVARLDGADPEAAIIEDANPALLQYCGGTAIPGAKFIDLFDWSDGRTPAEAIARASSGTTEPAEVVLKGESKREAHLVFAPARGGKRVAYVIDVSAWKDLERKFAQGNKMQAVGQLAGGVAHEFNNLLTALRLTVDELLGRHPVGDPSYADLQHINSTISRAAGLVKKLLAFSRKQTFRVETLEVPDVLSDFSILLRQILEETVKLEIVHGRDLPPIRADKGQLETAIINLVANGRDAMRESGGGTMTIRTSAATADEVREAGAPDPVSGEWVLIEVQDEGTGMDEATREKIFEPFFTTKPQGKGTGLGLATVYGIVKQSGGFLFVESELGKGTTFRLFLPATEATEEVREEVERKKAEKAIEPKPADLAGRGRILLVEDEDKVRMIAARTLAKRGYEVTEAEDGEKALAILQDGESTFDLLISDVVMPGLDGPGLVEKARDLLATTRIVFISGYAEEEFSHTLSREHDISFLPKPFTLSQLAEKVKSEIGARMEDADAA